MLAISVDLDEVHHYASLYGVPSREALGQVYRLAVPRLSDWARQRGLPLTWFVVGRDLEQPDAVEVIRRLSQAGDELACHSYSHHYDLTRRSATEIRSEIERGVSALQASAGGQVRGFRAPGYVVNDLVLDLLREIGLTYDASVLPSPAYYLVKAGAVGALAARRRKSSAILDVPEVLRAPSSPYRVGRPYWFRGTGITEIPIQVTPGTRLPFIGGALALAGTLGARLLARAVANEPFINLELHGLDVVDARDGLDGLAKYMRELRTPWTKKLEAIDAAVSVLRRRGHAAARMDELASRALA